MFSAGSIPTGYASYMQTVNGLFFACIHWLWIRRCYRSTPRQVSISQAPDKTHTHTVTGQPGIYRVSHELSSLLRESVPYVKIYRYNPKHLCPKLNGYGDNGKRKVWTSWGCTHYTFQLAVIYVRPCVECHVTECAVSHIYPHFFFLVVIYYFAGHY